MIEIGGYFELQNFRGREYHEKALRFNAARYGIAYEANVKHLRTVYIPAYLCNSVADTLRASGIRVDTYPISREWMPIFDKSLQDDEALLIANYFGQIENDMIADFRDRFHNIIVDNIQSFFQRPVDGVTTVYSCRKYFGVPDGAYLYTSADEAVYSLLDQDLSAARLGFLAGRFEEGAQKYYIDSRKNEDIIDQAGPRKMSAITENLLRAVDYDWCIAKRVENVSFLERRLDQYNQIRVKNHAGLFMYPLLQFSHKDLRNELISRKIFVPKLWPELSIPVSKYSTEWRTAEEIVWLPIDQRYTLSDMEYMTDIIYEICGWNL